ncbi:MAG: presenilin family intramembrane aspartyl protease [archaeon]
MNLFLKMLILFVITQLLGLYIANAFLQENIKTTIINDNPNDIWNAIGLISYILIFTGIFLLVMKFSKTGKILSLMEKVVVFSTTSIFVYLFVPELSFLFAILFLALRILLPESIMLRNISAIISSAVVGSLIGVSLNIIPVIVFVAALSIYDIIAVFFTKHMVAMAETLKEKNLALAFAIPTKEHNYLIGTGDLVIPLVFVVSAMSSFFAETADKFLSNVLGLIILVMSLLGIGITLWITKNKKMAMPALPLQCLFMIIAWFVFNFFF